MLISRKIPARSPFGLALLVLLPLLVVLGCHGEPSIGGAGSIAGSIAGRPYNNVGAAYLIGMPDDPEQTLVLYIFDAPVACDELTSPAWDERIADKTGSIELKLIGQAPGEYPVAPDGRPSSGESANNYTLTATSGTPAEVSANSGKVHLDSFEAGNGASGSFDLKFPGGSLMGTFDATWCADGHEP